MVTQTYNWQRFIAPPPTQARSSDEAFDRHTFNIRNRLHKNTLSQLRKMGGKRWFHFSWNIWNKRQPVDTHSMSQCLRLAVDKFWQKEPTLVIDAGCGDSADVDVLKEWGVRHIGYDLFPRIEERTYNLRSITGQPPITVKRKSTFAIQDICEDWQGVSKNTVDIVLCNAVIDLLTDEERVLFYKYCFKYLKKSGLVIIYGLALKNGHGYNQRKEVETLRKLGFTVTKERGLTVATK
jgi:Methyltransferase domain